jgi:hypothetical protein
MNDDFLEKMVMAAIENVAKHGPVNVDVQPPFIKNAEIGAIIQKLKDEAKTHAKVVRGLFEAYIEAGFSDSQAFELVKIQIENMKGKR